ncbi:DUF4382 domain-containing protein [Pararhodonellum marinum]|uniref:DUF4382 domain-containing protein n=1 Tax=Pararhodonellum marinum TaxID=2755358 RepID=UPI00188FD3D6|nr:DUF4382 domain-containing protein [Pararhodonellum marinum]
MQFRIKVLKKILSISIVLLGLLPLVSCFNDETERTNALVSFLLIDAPGDFDRVFIEVLGVECQPAGTRGQDNANSVFFPYSSSNKEIEVSVLVAGSRVLIGRGEVGVGLLSSVTLRLGDAHFVEVGGVRVPLTLSNSATNEIRVETDLVLDPGISYDIFIDFDIQRSIQRFQDNRFELNPQIRVFFRGNTGEISGRVTPVTAIPIIYAIQGQDTISTSINATNGDFLFMGLKEGDYSLFFEPLPTFLDTLFTVPVSENFTTEVEPFVLRALGENDGNGDEGEEDGEEEEEEDEDDPDEG